jgi:ribosomal protein S18 acetylase RimI-like enzyme
MGDDLTGTLRLLPEDAVVWPDVEAGDALYLYNLAVGRQWAGHGLGRQMLEWAAGWTESIGRSYLRLDCFAHNVFLRGYYESAGFKDCGRVDAKYPDPIGTLQLRRFEKSVRTP